MRKYLLMAFALFFGLGSLKADEGMWIPLLLHKNMAEMQKLGLKLTADEIYSINHASLKDAVVIFGGGCTGEIVSPEGLLFTNHHCGYSSIQKMSTVEHDYLKDGFWAYNKKEELPIPGLTVKFLVRMDDVTSQALKGVTDKMSEDEREMTVAKNSKEIANKASENGKYSAVVKPLFGGNTYYVYVYKVYRDIRLVGAPPSSIGKFGGDTDNWMWPRHTGDFSIFRVYMAPDGSPAKYSPDNVPLKPKKYLTINISPKKKGEFTMIMGNPGSTERYLSSYGVDMAINLVNPTIVKIRTKKLNIMKKAMDANPEVRLQYATKYAHTSNYWKYYIGQTQALKRLKVKAEKQQQEAEFMNWVNQNPERKAKYGDVLAGLKKAYEGLQKYQLAKYYFIEGIYRGPEILKFAANFSGLENQLKKKDANQKVLKEELDALKGTVNKHFKDYNQTIDRNLLAAMLRMYYQNVPKDQHPEYLEKIAKKYKGNFDKYATEVFKKSIFASKEKTEAFLNDPKAKVLEKDPALQAWNAFLDEYRQIYEKTKPYQELLAKNHRLYIAGILQMYPNKNFAPDANFTMRVTYGTIKGYSPQDAVYDDFVTHLYGVMQKEDPNNPEFIVPKKLKELYKAKDYGQYGENGHLITDFLSTNDITGGNSGSPIMNDRGQLIGLAFDGNWEAMSGDIKFDKALQRTINVDIRYVLFIIDKYAHAENLIKELTIVKDKPETKNNTENQPQPVATE
ncbi:S46 family peptidase [Candidatus Sulfidibacterium hydrothermale]|uniref:S46 family peptidase n=1 Tax=Candidatus Sulfidibacterium hydrothermale TaxID=2875962 RepID=UPI001F0B71C0|nr:S46 family peptidase [Candidatus Sulfidibacterium hydrothermale]UBM62330.1 S46 family peptidase [Candidatus Sulfidibacterium hydrothermale]